MDAILDLCRLSHEKRATMEELPATASVSIGDPYVSQRFELIVKPLPVECGFHCNRDRVSEWSEKIAQRVD
jgi:elongation factor P--beta-lysine ligase